MIGGKEIEQTVRDIVSATLGTHPQECVFKTNAVEIIVAQTLRNSEGSKESIINACEQAFRDAELLCPAHNGTPVINRMPTI